MGACIVAAIICGIVFGLFSDWLKVIFPPFVSGAVLMVLGTGLIGNAIATSLLGPLLILNPALTRWLLDTMGRPDAPLAFEEAVKDAYTRRLAEFCDPQVDVE